MPNTFEDTHPAGKEGSHPMLEITAGPDGAVIEADHEQLTAIRDGIDHALTQGTWAAKCLGPDGVGDIHVILHGVLDRA